MIAPSKHRIPDDFSCYDFVHPWHPNCKHAILEIAMISFKNSFKLYCSFYLLSALIQGKLFFPKKWPSIFTGVLHSTFFMSWNITALFSFVCCSRLLLKKFYPATVTWVPGFIAGLTGLQFERNSRKQALAVYALNIMSQSYFTILKDYGLIRSIPHGEVLLFSFSISIFMYLYKKRIETESLVTRILSILIGPNETRLQKTQNDNATNKKGQTVTSKTSLVCCFRELTESIHLGPKHKLCLHEKGCVYYGITGFFRPFLIAYLGKILIKSVTSLKLILRRPEVTISFFTSKSNVKFGLFVGGFTFLFRFLNCLLRWITNADEPINGLISGFIAGWSGMLFPSSGLSSYTFWKLIELFCEIGVKNGVIPRIPFGVDILYSILTASMFHVSVYHAHAIVDSYWKFLMGLTDSKYEMINRNALKMWGMVPSERTNLSLRPDTRYASAAMKKYLEEERSL